MATITGNNASNNLNGTDLADQIFGLGGNDILIGFDGDDVLEGGKGADQLFGSSGSTPRATRARRRASPSSSANPSSPAGTPLATCCSASRVCAARSSRTFYRVTTCAMCSTGTVAPTASTAPRATTSSTAAPATIDCSAAIRLRLRRTPRRRRGGSRLLRHVRRGESGSTWRSARASRGDATGDRLFGVEGVEGSELNDRISGNAAANRLIGNTGADLLSGAGGADRFVYFDTSNSTGTNGDSILDFSRAQGDRIDLAGIDANQLSSGNQAFRFIGAGEFTGVGQLRFLRGDGGTVIQANTTDAHPGAELVIVLEGLLNLQAGDFVL